MSKILSRSFEVKQNSIVRSHRRFDPGKIVGGAKDANAS